MKSIKPAVALILVTAMLLSVASCNSSSSRHKKSKSGSDGVLGNLTEPTSETSIVLETVSDPTEETTIAPTEPSEPSETTASPYATREPYSGDRIPVYVWDFTTEGSECIDHYCELYPEFDSTYEFIYTIIPTTSGMYQAALDGALASGENVPDIYAVEFSSLAHYTSGQMSEYAVPYADFIPDFDAKLEDAALASYIVEAGTRSSDNQIVGLGYQNTTDFFIYRRSFAMEVFGSDDPENVSNVIGSASGNMNNFCAAAEALAEHDISIVSANKDCWSGFFCAAENPWVVDGSLYIDPVREAYIDFALLLDSNNWTNSTMMWGESWFRDISSANSNVFAFIGPYWFINYSMGLGDDTYLATNPNYGDYAVTIPPMPSFTGGTWYFAGSMSGEVNPGAATVLEWMTVDSSETGLQYELATIGVNGLRGAVTSGAVLSFCDCPLDAFAGQDIFDVLLEADGHINGNVLSEYDETITYIWTDDVETCLTGDYSRTQAIAAFRETVELSLGIS